MTRRRWPGSRSVGRRTTAVVASLAVLGVALVAASVLRERGRSEAGASSSTPSAPVVDDSTVPAAASLACGPGPHEPLRTDRRFTAGDTAGTVVRYSISLPEDYWTACTHYPVVYALHGKGQSNVDFLDAAVSMRRAMAAGVLEQAVIVTPDSYLTGRWENRATGPAEDNLITYLIPHIEQRYRVKAGPSQRLLTGFSMGGHGAFRFGLKYPQLFAAVWSVDGAMSGAEIYLPFVTGRTTTDFHIMSVGGRLNGSRVKSLVDALRGRGIEIPYTYQDLDHDFVTFVEEDERTGWVAMKYLQSNLGRAM